MLVKQKKKKKKKKITETSISSRTCALNSTFDGLGWVEFV